MKRTFRKLFGALCLVVVLGTLSGQAAVELFLDLGPDIPGESTDKAHAGQVDVLAWSWGLSNSGTTHVGGGAGAGKANFQDLSVTKWVDKASPKLMLNCANGAHIATAVLYVRKAGAPPLDYITITMTDVLVTSVSTGGSGGEDRLTENISFNFAKVRVDYFPADPKGGVGRPISFTWDIALNQGG